MNEIKMQLRVDAIETPREGMSQQSGNPYFIIGVQATKIGLGQQRLRFEVSGKDRWDMMQMEVGKTYECMMDVQSREVTSQRTGTKFWMTEVRCYMAKPLMA